MDGGRRTSEWRKKDIRMEEEGPQNGGRRTSEWRKKDIRMEEEGPQNGGRRLIDEGRTIGEWGKNEEG